MSQKLLWSNIRSLSRISTARTKHIYTEYRYPFWIFRRTWAKYNDIIRSTVVVCLTFFFFCLLCVRLGCRCWRRVLFLSLCKIYHIDNRTRCRPTRIIYEHKKKKDDIPYIRSGREIFRPFCCCFSLGMLLYPKWAPKKILGQTFSNEIFMWDKMIKRFGARSLGWMLEKWRTFFFLNWNAMEKQNGGQI